MTGFTVGTEPWLNSQRFPALKTQKDAAPLITFSADHERP